MAEMTPKQAQTYLERWQLVRAAEVAELQATPIETKLTQLAALMASREAFPAEPNRDIEIREVRERWARVRQAFGG